MRVQSHADMLLGLAARGPARALNATALPDGRSRAKRAAERQKRPAERDRRRADPLVEDAGQRIDDAAPSDPGLALASTLAHLALTAVRDAQVSCNAARQAYAEVE